MTANFHMVITHPQIAELGLNILEQGRISSFAVDLCHWLTGAQVDSLGLLARVTLMIVQDELEVVRARCIAQETVTVEAAAAITSQLWPRLRTADQPTNAPEEATVTTGPVLTLLRECCGLDLPELLYLTQALEAELNEDDTRADPAAAILMQGISKHTLDYCDQVANPTQAESNRYGKKPNQHQGRG
jgi:hypothetical protein